MLRRKKLTLKLFILSIIFIEYSSAQNNMYSLTDWNTGTGNITDFYQYGITSSNLRELGNNHINESIVLWKAIPNPSSFADGGIVGAYKTIDISKTYRLSIWLKKTNSNSGTTYFGCTSLNSAHQTLNIDGSLNNNPYFFAGDLPKLDHWYLLTGYVHHQNYSGPVLGKIYDGTTGEEVSSVQREFKFSSAATNLRLRSFFAYDTNLNDRLYLYEPHMELIDGSESSIEQLLGVNPDSKLLFAYDNAGNQKQRYYCEDFGCVPPAGIIDSDNHTVSEAIASQDTVEEAIVSNRDISVYPNPTKDNVTISLNLKSEITMVSEIKLYNTNGVAVKTIPNQNKATYNLDLSNVSSGIYFIHFHLSNGSHITKSIIKN